MLAFLGMGWLRDLMDQAPEEVRSFDELAKLCLKSDRWPASTQMGHRSLGAILGRLDRGEQTEWLSGRAEVQQALAGVLGVPRGTLSVAVNPRRAGKAERWLTFQSMPLARGLDLLEEPLFPGIPEALLHPGRWDRLVWVAPHGAGRSLLGTWLEARGLAAHRALPSLDQETLSEARPLLLELGSGVGLTTQHLGAGLCVAVPEPWEPSPGFGDCVIVRSPPLAELVVPLLHWARDRLADNSQVTVELLAPRVLELVEQGLVESAGDVLGLVGVADAEGMEAVEARGLERAAREWFKRRARERLDAEAPDGSWLRKRGFEALVSVAEKVATASSEALFCPRSFDDWSDLVPSDLQPAADVEWMKAVLPDADPLLRPAAIQRASEKLPPGAFRLLRSFEHMGLIERAGDFLALRPHWLGRVVLHEALGKIVSGPAFDWGEALLSPAMAEATMERLVRAACARALPSEELVEPASSADPGYAATIEGAVRAFGAAELAGVHAGGEALEALWDEQLRLSVELDGRAIGPRVDHVPARTFWLGRGAWYLAVLAVSEALDSHQGGEHTLLRPWEATEPPEGLTELLDHVAAALDHANAPHAVIGPAVALISRLGAVLGPLGLGRARHRLERAATVADEAAVGVLAWPSVSALEGDRLAILGLLQLVKERRLEHEGLARQVWQAFESAAMPELEASVLLTPELAPIFLPHAPPAVLPALARGIAELAVPPELGVAQWGALLSSDARATPLGLFRVVPEAALMAAVDVACRSARLDALGVLWARFPTTLTAAVVSAILHPEASAGRGFLLDTAPISVTATVLDELESVDELLRGPAATLEAVRRFLHGRIGARGPGFREAYALFDELEQHLAEVRALG